MEIQTRPPPPYLPGSLIFLFIPGTARSLFFENSSLFSLPKNNGEWASPPAVKTPFAPLSVVFFLPSFSIRTSFRVTDFPFTSSFVTLQVQSFTSWGFFARCSTGPFFDLFLSDPVTDCFQILRFPLPHLVPLPGAIADAHSFLEGWR